MDPVAAYRREYTPVNDVYLVCKMVCDLRTKPFMTELTGWVDTCETVIDDETKRPSVDELIKDLGLTADMHIDAATASESTSAECVAEAVAAIAAAELAARTDGELEDVQDRQAAIAEQADDQGGQSGPPHVTQQSSDS